MDKVRKTLWKDYNAICTRIESESENGDKYKSLLEERDKIRNELIKLEQGAIDAELKRDQMVNEIKLKEAQIEAEDKREKIRNRITIGTFAVSTGISLYAIIRTFRFDENSTVTSTLGRYILSGFIPKMFKR